MAIQADSVQQTYETMQSKLARLVPEIELRYKAELVYEIERLKRERGAIILGHNYMEPALFHTVPDVVGDSLELSRKAALTECDPIVFCGVRFMAETAKILNPNKTVLLPAVRAGCSLAESITAQDVLDLKELYPGVPVVVYINTYADIKAVADYCCTSGNAARVVNSLGAQRVIFLPDEYLAGNVAVEAGRDIMFVDRSADGALVKPTTTGAGLPVGDSGTEIIGWRGRCEVHERFTVQDIKDVRSQFPGTLVLAHPECSPEVVQASDFSASTSQMTQFVREKPAPHFLILTECSMGDNIMAANPDRDILRLCSIRCPHMNEITLEDTLKALRDNVQVIDVPEPVRSQARRSLERMLAL